MNAAKCSFVTSRRSSRKPGFQILIAFTVLWVITSIASGQSGNVTNAAFESPALSSSVNPSTPTLYSQTSVELKPFQPIVGDADMLQPLSGNTEGILLTAYQNEVPATPDTTDAAAEPFLDLTNEPEANANATPEPSTNAELFVQLAIWTVIILCACILVVLGIRYVQRRQGLLPEADHQSRVLQTLSLGAHRTVSLVQLGEVRAIVGCDSTGVSNIVLAPNSFELELLTSNPETGHDVPDSLFEGTKLAS